MATLLRVPFLDANILDATVIAWRVSAGDKVSAGEIVVDITTDKAAYEIETPTSGTLLEILAPPGSIVPIEFILGVIGTPGEVTNAAELNATLVEAYRSPKAAEKSAASANDGTLRASPKARRLANELGISLADIAAKTGATMITEQMVRDFK